MPVEPALDDVGRAGAPAELSMGTGQGRFELRFSAPADVGALVEAAVAEARDALFAAGVPEVTGPVRCWSCVAGRSGRWSRSAGGTRSGCMCTWTPRVAG